MDATLAGAATGERVQLDAVARQHIDLVYAAALRQLRRPADAADATQAVFLILQKNWGRLSGRAAGRPWIPGEGLPPPALAAWLLRATRYACLTVRQRDYRRQKHEGKAAAMRTKASTGAQPGTPEPDWSAAIDAALAKLPKADREAIAAVYFEGLTHRQLAERVGVTDTAAHKRVQRAVAKLRRLLGRRGVSLPVLAVAGALAAVGRPAPAPAAVVQGVIKGLGGQVPAQVSVLTKGTTMMMRMVRVKLVGLGVTAVAVASLMGMAVFNTARAQTPAPAPAPAAAPPVVLAPSTTGQVPGMFTPVKELTVNSEMAQSSYAADLEAGETASPPRTVDRGPMGFLPWFADHGIDVGFDGRGIAALMGYDMVVLPVARQDFDRMSADAMMGNLSPCTPGAVAVMSAEGVSPTYLFRTREGGVGLLQITDVQTGRRGAVTFRYKLLTPAARDRAALDAAAMMMNRDKPLFDALAAGAGGGHMAGYLRALAEMLRGTPWEKSVRQACAAAEALAAPGNAADAAATLAGHVKETMDRVRVEVGHEIARRAPAGQP
jgi:RNA polymerase sigma factor (sigma-70 family)